VCRIDGNQPHSQQGSGIVIHKDGYVLTNAHVVNGASKVEVTLIDGRRFNARVAGMDEIIDVAVLQLEQTTTTTTTSSPNIIIMDNDNNNENAFDTTTSTVQASQQQQQQHDDNGEPPDYNNGRVEEEKEESSLVDQQETDDNDDNILPIAELGNSDELKVGRWVIAVGSPGGLDNTVTIGIVSGLERTPAMVGLPQKGVLYIQTDAAVNPGNSGGPLVDVASGKVIGINTCVRSNMEGTSFAIPINRAKDILETLQRGERVSHGYVGVTVKSVNVANLRESVKGLPIGSSSSGGPGGGAGITTRRSSLPVLEKVFKNAPASRAGLKPLDVILEVGGEEVETSNDFVRLVDGATIGEDLPIKIIRNDREMTIRVKPDDLIQRKREADRMINHDPGPSADNSYFAN